MKSLINKNTLAFVALAHEFCTVMENSQELESADEFVDKMLKLLPRMYICISDISVDEPSDAYIEPYLDESHYEEVKMEVSALLGADDTYLEVFESDMKYSETPIGSSISEGLADIFQDLYNFMSNIKDAPNEVIESCTIACKENFENYWGQTLCNVLRPLNAIKYNNNLK